MEPISKEQQLEQTRQALAVQGISVTVPVLYQIELTQQKIAEVGESFTIKDATEIRAQVNERFPVEKYPQYYQQ